MSNFPNHSGVAIWADEKNAGHSISESRASVSVTEAIPVAKSGEVASWSDAQLILAVRCDPPDEAALDVLVARHWNTIFGRCQMLTLNYEKALDLAQSAWCRLLRNRHALKPDGNFPAYLIQIAKNLFRDSCRTARRAGPMADRRLVSLDDAYSNADGETIVLEEIVPDLKSLQPQEQMLLAIDINRALENLTPRLREVLLARFIEGESCVDIGVRYGRTKQAVNGWIREALRQMKTQLEEPSRAPDRKNADWSFESTGMAVAFSAMQEGTYNRSSRQ
jgi:RNA polymerase sigma factor (sigma-70 family)